MGYRWGIASIGSLWNLLSWRLSLRISATKHAALAGDHPLVDYHYHAREGLHVQVDLPKLFPKGRGSMVMSKNLLRGKCHVALEVLDPQFVGTNPNPFLFLFKQSCVCGALPCSFTKTEQIPSPSPFTILYGCFLKWWYPQNTPKWSLLVGKPMVVGYHHFKKPPYQCINLIPSFHPPHLSTA